MATRVEQAHGRMGAARARAVLWRLICQLKMSLKCQVYDDQLAAALSPPSSLSAPATKTVPKIAELSPSNARPIFNSRYPSSLWTL